MSALVATTTVVFSGASRRIARRTTVPHGGARSAAIAQLRYVMDEAPGIRRQRRGAGMRYIHPDGSSVRDIETLRRIKRLAVPPAWTDVWICTEANGHLQAVGRDARGAPAVPLSRAVAPGPR